LQRKEEKRWGKEAEVGIGVSDLKMEEGWEPWGWGPLAAGTE
jgi:hypothetical protein